MSEIRRRPLGVLLCVFVVSAGCVGVLTGSEPAVFTASPASVDDDAVSSTDFELEDTRTEWLNRTVDAAGQSREIRAQNHVGLYERPLSLGADGSITFGLFTVASTPQASIAGQPMNPIGKMSYQELIDRAACRSEDVEDVRRVDARTMTVLGTETEVVRFAGVVRRSGQEVPVYIEVTRVKHDGDFVLAVGAYPQETADDVRPEVTTLFQGVEH